MPAPTERIGVAGLGRMGSAIASALRAKGFTVSGWNRTPRGTPADYPVHGDLAALTAASDFILLSLFDDSAVTEVLETLLACDLAGRLIVDTSTVRPDTLAAFAPRLEAAGASALDAPISGGPEMVRDATAGFFVGGAASDLARFRPVAEAFAGRIRHVGPLGQGAAAKIVNNMMLAGHWQTLSEAMKVGRRAGLPARTIVDIIADGPAGTAALRGRTDVILGESDRVGFPVSGGLKDAELFLVVARSLGVDTPTITALRTGFAALVDRGLAGTDLAMLIREAAKDR